MSFVRVNSSTWKLINYHQLQHPYVYIYFSLHALNENQSQHNDGKDHCSEKAFTMIQIGLCDSKVSVIFRN